MAELTQKGVEEKILDILADKLDKPKNIMKPETNLVNDLGADSLDAVEIMMDLEDKFDFDIPEKEAEKVKTVKDIFKLVEEKLGIIQKSV